MTGPKQHNESDFIRHVPCENCGSSDANSLYTDGHLFCFSCGTHVNDGGNVQGAPRKKVAGLLTPDGIPAGLPSRSVSEETCQHFGYAVGYYSGKPCQIAPYYDADRNLVAQKLRFGDKTFAFVGDSSEALPFGAQLWNKTGKKLVVTEGEIDALSMSQVQGNKWPVVSIASGAGPQVKKYVAKHRDYFLGFEEVIFMFDMDEIGQQAAREAAAVIGHRAKIASLPLKDANEMLMAGRVKELIDAMWRAEAYRPEGIVTFSSLRDEVLKKPEPGLSWPFQSLTDLTYGIRLGELYAFGAGTGIGKTDFFAETIMHLVAEHGQKVGVFSLEQQPKETVRRIVGKYMSVPVHLPDCDCDDEDIKEAFDEIDKRGKIFLYDSFGANDWQVIREKIEYLYHAEDVKYIFLDHLTALAAVEEDERKALDGIMAEMAGTAKKLNITIFLISHLATPDGKPHEEGGRVMIRHFRGSRAIGFWCHYMFGLERNQQADTEAERRTTTFRVLKDRYTGRATGAKFFFSYEFKTGRLYECGAPGDQGAEHFFAEEEEAPADF